ncbi:heparinase II/III family protein [Roseobacter sp. HKCCA0434]|uniref:heparinase II/III family protein n=1 Tax=Roseobacter sp. HKCCA0434 TaxID=3079297 RepID=UPI0029057F8A|nr:heparinase II/III family protein [Roseobacter sp. HKCCA0434]
MARSTLSTRARSADNRLQAWRSAFGGKVTGIAAQPQPWSLGTVAGARALQSGEFRFAGELVEAPATGIWDVPSPHEAFTCAVQGFGWLDDLAAAGDATARMLAQDWLWQWIERFGAARGPGWYPDLTGRRLMRWIVHAPFVLKGQDAAARHAFFKSLGRQVSYLAHAWPDAAPGLPRFEALIGLIHAAVALEGAEGLLKPARRGLAKLCEGIGPDGGLRSRNPEELLEVFALLIQADRAQRAAGHPGDAAVEEAIARIAPTLRALRLGDGALGRFNGGARGAEGLIDRSLAESGVRTPPQGEAAMGYARMRAGRTVLLMDAGATPAGIGGLRAHAGALSFEMSAGRRPLIVNQGPGDAFGPDWRRHARETGAHSTVQIGEASMARFAPASVFGCLDTETLEDGPKAVTLERAVDRSGHWLLASHDGWVASHGLTHERRLFMTPDGAELRGEDTLSAQSTRERARFARMREGAAIDWCARFHLHPDVEAELDPGGEAVRLSLRSGEVWIFRQSGGALSLEPSTYLDGRRLNPRLTQQIVVRTAAMDYASRINWVVGRAGAQARAIRDLEDAS